MNSDSIQKSIEVVVTPESVFRAISDEKELQKWWVDIPKLEQSVGGAVLFRFLKENSKMLEKDFVIEGKILEIIPNQKLSYTWKPVDDHNYPDTIVTWIIDSIHNKTKVTVMDSGLENAKDYSQLNEGWAYFTNKLANFLNSKP
jgi:uncharacterized protein YndB with AHSA1/START domain